MLIIEDGSIVAGANSFTTDAELVAYALARNVTLPATESERDVLQILAMDYLFSIENELKGFRVSELQELPYPRQGVCANDFLVASDTIPVGVKRAMLELAMQVVGSDLLVNAPTQNLKREKLDVLEVEYFSGGSWVNIRTDKADAYLDPYKINNGNSNILQRVMR